MHDDIKNSGQHGDAYIPNHTDLSAEDQRFIAELRKFFEFMVRDMFLIMAEYGQEVIDIEYIRKVIGDTRRDEHILAAVIRDAIRSVVKTEFSHIQTPVTIYRDDEIVAMIRNEAQILVSAYRRIKEHEAELEYLRRRES